MSLWSRLVNVFRSQAIEREIDEELQFHVDERIHELMGDGMTRATASARAESRCEAGLVVGFTAARRAAWRADAAETRARLGCGDRVAGVGVGRMRGGVIAGRCADPQAAAGAATRSTDLSDSAR